MTNKPKSLAFIYKIINNYNNYIDNFDKIVKIYVFN